MCLTFIKVNTYAKAGLAHGVLNNLEALFQSSKPVFTYVLFLQAGPAGPEAPTQGQEEDLTKGTPFWMSIHGRK